MTESYESVLCSQVWWALLLTKLVKLRTKRVFCFCSRNEFHETSFLPLLTKRVLTKRVLTKRVFGQCSRNEFHETSFLFVLTKRVLTKRDLEHCSRNECSRCSRNEFKTREQISLSKGVLKCLVGFYPLLYTISFHTSYQKKLNLSACVGGEFAMRKET